MFTLVQMYCQETRTYLHKKKTSKRLEFNLFYFVFVIFLLFSFKFIVSILKHIYQSFSFKIFLSFVFIS